MIGWFPKKAPSGLSPDTVALVQSSTVSEVIDLVDRGKVSRADALAAEEAGKARTTLLKALSE